MGRTGCGTCMRRTGRHDQAWVITCSEIVKPDSFRPATEIGFSSESPATAVGVNVLKGEADPLLRPESEYPTWLWELTQPQPVLSQLRKAGMDGLDLAQVCTLLTALMRQHLFSNPCSAACKPIQRPPGASAEDAFLCLNE